jgi:hypothetical protein
MNLDLGSGPNPYRHGDEDPYIGVDLHYGRVAIGRDSFGLHADEWRDSLDDVKPGEVVKADLRLFPWVWCPSHVVDRVWCSNYISYQTAREWVSFTNELWRILKPGAQAFVIWPNLKTGAAFEDPLYQDQVPLERWSFSSRRWRQHMGVEDGRGYPTADFTILEFGWEGLHDDVIVMPTPAEEVAAFVEKLLSRNIRNSWEMPELRAEWEQIQAGDALTIRGRAEDAKQQESSHWWDFAHDSWVMLAACCPPGEHKKVEKETHWVCATCGTVRQPDEPE